LKVRRLCNSKTVIICNGDEGGLLGFISKRAKLIYTNRYPNFDRFLFGADWSKYTTWLRILFREPRFAAQALAARAADHVACTSTFSLEQVRECFSISPEKLTVIHNGIDPLFLSQKYRDNGQKGILYFGRLTHAKGVDTLLQAYAQLSEEVKQEHQLKIIGQGPYQERLQALAEELEIMCCVCFEGWTTRQILVEEILSNRLTVLPSREESFGNTMLEVLALGAPLVTSNAGSIQEVAGDWGRKVDPDNPQALAAAIQEELERRPDQDTMEGQVEFVRGRYSWGKTAGKFLAL
jgi:glycosyltransferase involved in cell wall biosynthesis